MVDGQGNQAGRRRVGIGTIARRGQSELSLSADLPEEIVALPKSSEDRRATQCVEGNRLRLARSGYSIRRTVGRERSAGWVR